MLPKTIQLSCRGDQQNLATFDSGAFLLATQRLRSPDLVLAAGQNPHKHSQQLCKVRFPKKTFETDGTGNQRTANRAKKGVLNYDFFLRPRIQTCIRQQRKQILLFARRPLCGAVALLLPVKSIGSPFQTGARRVHE